MNNDQKIFPIITEWRLQHHLLRDICGIQARPQVLFIEGDVGTPDLIWPLDDESCPNTSVCAANDTGAWLKIKTDRLKANQVDAVRKKHRYGAD